MLNKFKRNGLSILIGSTGSVFLIFYLLHEYREYGSMPAVLAELSETNAALLFHIMVLLAPIISIYVAYLFDKRISLQRELTTMLELSQHLNTTLDIRTLMQISIDESVKVSGLGTGAIYLLDGDDMLKLWATTPPLPRDFPEKLRLMPMADHPHIKKAIKSKHHLVMVDTAKTSLTSA